MEIWKDGQRGHTSDLRSENAKKAFGDLMSYKLKWRTDAQTGAGLTCDTFISSNPRENRLRPRQRPD